MANKISLRAEKKGATLIGVPPTAVVLDNANGLRASGQLVGLEILRMNGVPVLLFGPAGTGKTSLIKELAQPYFTTAIPTREMTQLSYRITDKTGMEARPSALAAEVISQFHRVLAREFQVYGEIISGSDKSEGLLAGKPEPIVNLVNEVRQQLEHIRVAYEKGESFESLADKVNSFVNTLSSLTKMMLKESGLSQFFVEQAGSAVSALYSKVVEEEMLLQTTEDLYKFSNQIATYALAIADVYHNIAVTGRLHTFHAQEIDKVAGFQDAELVVKELRNVHDQLQELPLVLDFWGNPVGIKIPFPNAISFDANSTKASTDGVRIDNLPKTVRESAVIAVPRAARGGAHNALGVASSYISGILGYEIDESHASRILKVIAVALVRVLRRRWASVGKFLDETVEIGAREEALDTAKKIFSDGGSYEDGEDEFDFVGSLQGDATMGSRRSGKVATVRLGLIRDYRNVLDVALATLPALSSGSSQLYKEVIAEIDSMARSRIWRMFGSAVAEARAFLESLYESNKSNGALNEFFASFASLVLHAVFPSSKEDFLSTKIYQRIAGYVSGTVDVTPIRNIHMLYAGSTLGEAFSSLLEASTRVFQRVAKDLRAHKPVDFLYGGDMEELKARIEEKATQLQKRYQRDNGDSEEAKYISSIVKLIVRNVNKLAPRWLIVLSMAQALAQAIVRESGGASGLFYEIGTAYLNALPDHPGLKPLYEATDKDPVAVGRTIYTAVLATVLMPFIVAIKSPENYTAPRAAAALTALLTTAYLTSLRLLKKWGASGEYEKFIKAIDQALSKFKETAGEKTKDGGTFMDYRKLFYSALLANDPETAGYVLAAEMMDEIVGLKEIEQSGGQDVWRLWDSLGRVLSQTGISTLGVMDDEESKRLIQYTFIPLLLASIIHGIAEARDIGAKKGTETEEVALSVGKQRSKARRKSKGKGKAKTQDESETLQTVMEKVKKIWAPLLFPHLPSSLDTTLREAIMASVMGAFAGTYPHPYAVLSEWLKDPQVAPEEIREIVEEVKKHHVEDSGAKIAGILLITLTPAILKATPVDMYSHPTYLAIQLERVCRALEERAGFDAGAGVS